MNNDTPPPAITDLHLRSLLDASPVGMLVFNDREEIILANPPAERLFGLTPQNSSAGRYGDAVSCANRLKTAKGCGYSDACPSCLLFRALKATFAGTASPTDQEGEVELDREPGCAPLWIRFKIRPLVIDGLQGAILTVDDISDLRQSEQQYTMLFQEMLNAFALHEMLYDDQGQPVDYRFLSVNPAFERMTGLSVARIVGRTALEVFPVLETHLIGIYGRVVLTGEPVHFEHFSREIGKYFSITAFRPASGQFACLFEDITERKQAAEKLERSEANYRAAYTLLRSMCDNVPDMIWAKDLENRYLFTNTALCRGLLNAVDTEEPIGKSDLFFAERERANHAEEPQWHSIGELNRDSDAAVINAGSPMQFDEFGNVRGRFLFLDVRKAPFLDENGKIIGTVGSARDVTAVKEMEQQLREREERLNLAIRGADLSSWDWHIPSGTMVRNQRWAEMLGYSAEEIKPVLDSWSTRIHPDDAGRVKNALARHLAGETESYETEHRLRHKSGEWIWVLDKGRVIERDSQGNPLRACGTHLDITRQRILIEQSRDGIVILDSQGKVREANRSFADMIGYTPEEVQHLHVWDWDTQWTQEQLLQAIAQIDTTGDFFETYHRRKDGSVFPVEISTNGSMCTGAKMVFCVCRDISERKRAEETLKASEMRFQGILQNVETVAVQGYSMDGTVRYWNRASESFYGYTAEEALGRNLLDLIIPPDMREGVIAEIRSMAETGMAIPASELTLLRKDRSLIPVYSSHALVQVPGQDTEFFCIDTDLTERKRMEEEQGRLQAQLIHAQKMEAIGTLAGGIAHDFNNILGAVIGYAEMARDESPPGSVISQDIDRVIEAGNRAAALVKQILAFSRQQKSERIPIDPNLIVKEVVKLLRPSLPSTIAISLHITADHRVFADPTQLHQVLMNLATNAFHAMEQHGGSLRITIEDVEYSEADLASNPGIAPGPFVRLSVADTGPGIPREIRDRIFDPYFTTKETGKGTGMGLAIADGIVRGSGGFITCESEPGRGTIFTIALPAFNGDAAGKDREEESMISAGGGRILLVDDEEILVTLGRSMLERLGYEVTVHTSSLEALVTFQNDPYRFDAVVTDQTMPGMTGLDLARRMLQIRPDLPIILCTGYSNLVNEARAKAYGIKSFAMKPLAKKEIAALLKKVMK